MTRRHLASASTLAAVLSLVAALIHPLGAQQTKADVALRAADELRTVRRDFKGAIEAYKKIESTYRDNRPVVAQALVHMAECYQAIGDGEATRIYERVVRDFTDQKQEATVALARLRDAPGVASARGDRVVWIGPKVDASGQVSLDGRFLIGRDPDGGNLLIHDIAANRDRALTPPAPADNWSQFAGNSRISTDGRQVAYVWWDNRAGARVRLASLQPSGFLEPREVFRAGCSVDGCPFIGSLDMSPDRSSIVAAIPMSDRVYQITLIDVAGGSSRVLKSVDGAPQNIFFSSDGRYVAYDRPANPENPKRDVFVLAIDGGSEIPAIAHSANDTVMGWTPDGTRLLFSSDRTGAAGLWALPFADGKVQAPPALLKSDIGSGVSLGVTAAGALFVHKRINTRDIAIAPIDLEAGKLLAPPVSFTQGFVGGAKNPSWSPDANYLAYQGEEGAVIAIRSVATGQTQLLPRRLQSIDAGHLDWSPDGQTLLTRATDRNGRRGIFRIDVQSGEVTAVLFDNRLSGLTQWSPDGRKVYFSRGGVCVELDISSGAEREVSPELRSPQSGPLSPDGEYFVRASPDPYGKANSLLLVPAAEGTPREILRLSPPETIGTHIEWTHDSSAVLIVKNTGSRRELWMVPVTGGRPRRLEIDPNIWVEGSERPGEPTGDQGFILSPEGRRIAFLVGKNAPEVWALENFLPSAKAKR